MSYKKRKKKEKHSFDVHFKKWPKAYFNRLLGDGSAFSNSITSSKLFTYHELTRFTDGCFSKLSGKRAISFMMFARRTGSSLRKNVKDFFSHAFVPEIKNVLSYYP